MIKALSDIAEQPKVIRQSGISCGLRCERCFLFNTRWGLRRKVQKFTAAPNLGRIYHRLMELGPTGVEKVKAECMEQQKALMVRINAGEDLTGDLARAAQAITDLFSRAKVMAELFWQKFPVPDYLVVVATEQEIVGEIKGIKYPCGGRIDVIMKDMRPEAQGATWIRDHKTLDSKVPIPDYLAGCRWTVQGRFYRLIASLIKDLTTPRGFILDVAQKPGIKCCDKDEKEAKKSGCSVEEAYRRRVVKWYEERGMDGMTSKAIIYNEPVLNPELWRAIQIISALLDYDPKPEFFARDITGSYCRNYNRKCDYLELCDTDPAAWPEIINHEFEFVQPEVEEKEDFTENESD